MPKDLVLCLNETRVFLKLDEAYLLYLCERETLKNLSTPQIVWLADQVLKQHENQVVH